MLRCSLVAIFVVLFYSVTQSVSFADGKQPDTPDQGDDFLKIGFGTGVALSIDAGGGKDRVKSASVVDGIVRVEDEENSRAGVVLELHYFFEPDISFASVVDKNNWGHGPFIVLQPGSGEIINAIGLGWMIGFRNKAVSKNSSTSWNLGIGLIVDPNVKVLGDGIEANKPLPGNETEVRFKEESETAFVIMASFKW